MCLNRIEIENQNDDKQGADWSLVRTCSPWTRHHLHGRATTPWEAQRRPRIELPSHLPTSVVDLCCRALDCRHVCTAVANGPRRSCSPLLFACISIFTFRLCLDTLGNFNFIEIEMTSIFNCAIRFCLARPHTVHGSTTLGEQDEKLS